MKVKGEMKVLDAKKVTFDASALYLLATLGRWPGVDAGDISAARAALTATSLGPVAEKLRAMADSGMREAVVPFKRPMLDVGFAALAAHAGHDFELASFGTQVDAGYFQVRHGDVRYIDTVEDTFTTRGRLLEPWGVQGLHKLLSGPPVLPTRYRVPADVLEEAAEGGSDRLEAEAPATAVPLPGEVLRVAGPWVARCLAPTPTQTVFGAQAQLLVPDGRTGSRVVSLGELPLYRHGEDLVLQNLRPERLMELQAAALDCAWLLMSYRAFQCLGPLPDLLQPGDARDVWWHPVAVLEEALGARARIPVELDAEVTQRLLARVPWAWVHSPRDMFRLARQALTSGVPST